MSVINTDAQQFEDYESDLDTDDELNCIDVGIINENSKRTRKMSLILNCSAFFPCKVGGKPKWLHYTSLPILEKDLICKNCNSLLTFLLQIYAPLHVDDDNLKQSSFHRVLLVFICASQTCSPNKLRTVKVFRSQMARKNPIYSFDPPPLNTDDELSVTNFIYDFNKKIFQQQLNKFCFTCGLPCNRKCAKCKYTYYCSEAHQKFDWIDGNHKEICAMYNLKEDFEHKMKIYCQNEIDTLKLNENQFLFPENEILIEPEAVDNDSDCEIDNEKLDQQLKSNKNLSKDLESMPETEHDEDFELFKKRIQNQSKQVIRYDRGGQPLWCTKQSKIQDTPKCQNCGSNRVFEFQINPQLLNYLKLVEDPNSNNVDWAGLYIYTCQNNCCNLNYVEEFIYKQDYT